MPYSFTLLNSDPDLDRNVWTASTLGITVADEPGGVDVLTQAQTAVGKCRRVTVPPGGAASGLISQAWIPSAGQDWLYVAAHIKPLVGFPASTSFKLILAQWEADNTWLGYSLSLNGALPAGRWGMLRGHIATNPAAGMVAFAVMAPPDVIGGVDRVFLVDKCMVVATDQNPPYFDGAIAHPAYGEDAVVAWGPTGEGKNGASIIFDKKPGLWVKERGVWVSEYPGAGAPPPPVPPTMAAPTVTPGQSRLDVRWQAVTVPSGSIDHYEFRADEAAPSVSYTTSGTLFLLTGGRSYAVTVRAVSDQGVAGAWSPPRYGTPTSPPPPAGASWNGRLPLPAGSQTLDFTDDDQGSSDLDNGSLPLTPLGAGGVLRLINHSGEWDKGPENDQWAMIQMYDSGNDETTVFYPTATTAGTKFYLWNDGPGYISWAEPVNHNEYLPQGGWDTNGLASPGMWGEDAIVLAPGQFVEMEYVAGGTVRLNRIAQAG